MPHKTYATLLKRYMMYIMSYWWWWVHPCVRRIYFKIYIMLGVCVCGSHITNALPHSNTVEFNYNSSRYDYNPASAPTLAVRSPSLALNPFLTLHAIITAGFAGFVFKVFNPGDKLVPSAVFRLKKTHSFHASE